MKEADDEFEMEDISVAAIWQAFCASGACFKDEAMVKRAFYAGFNVALVTSADLANTVPHKVACAVAQLWLAECDAFSQLVKEGRA